MKKIFFIGISLLFLFELLNVWFIMPLPGSQKMNSIDFAYFLFSNRWLFRTFFSFMVLISFIKTKWKHKWIPWLFLFLLSSLVYVINSKMAADQMFRKINYLIMSNASLNKVDTSQLIIGVEINGEAKAYPIQFLGYHHQVVDTINGSPVMVTYCSVCRTGRVYEPKVKGKYEVFRLVGMDHFNAMFEDATTKSWWRQVNGEAIAGELKGERLPEIMSTQTSLNEWLQIHPKSLIMQADTSFTYSSFKDYESGKSKNELTGTDSSSWNTKSWVIGVDVDNLSKAYDWNKLVSQRIIHDKIGNTPVLIILSSGNKGFFAFERSSEEEMFTFRNDTLFQNKDAYRIDGTGIGTVPSLKRIKAFQEFWHSWRTFHPETKTY